MKRTLIASIALACLASAAHAGDEGSYYPSDSTGPMPVIGDVPTICAVRPLDGDGIFNVGTLIDTTTGFLRSDLSAPSQVLTASYCNARSVINVTAEPMTAQSYAGAAPSGFSKDVDFTATASGWTEDAAVYATGSASHPAASRTRDSAHSGDITVSLSDFATKGGSALRPVADPEYRGQVVVTLGVAD
jgi:hypothetical protein